MKNTTEQTGCVPAEIRLLAEQLSQRCATGHRSAVTLHHVGSSTISSSLLPPFTIYPPSFSIPHSDPPTSSPLAPSRSSIQILLGPKGGEGEGALLPRAFKGKGVGSRVGIARRSTCLCFRGNQIVSLPSLPLDSYPQILVVSRSYDVSLNPSISTISIRWIT